MKQIILLGIFLGGVLGRPQAELAPAAAATKANVTIVKNDQTYNEGKGDYSYNVELSDGTKFMQTGGTIPPPAGGNDTEPILVVKGLYAYVDPNGKTVEIKYIADDKGYQPIGDSIPTVSSNSQSAAAAAPPAPVSVATADVPAPVAAAAAPAPVAPVAEPVQETAPLQSQESSIAFAPSALA